MGRPRGKGPTVFWTHAERSLVRQALDDLLVKLPRRKLRSIVEMMKRMEQGEFDD